MRKEGGLRIEHTIFLKRTRLLAWKSKEGKQALHNHGYSMTIEKGRWVFL